MHYYIGLDNGGSTTKAAIYDQNGKELHVSSVETKMIVPRPNFTERDMEEMWDANVTVIKKVINDSGISADDIVGLAVCGHGKGLYLWGKDNKPAYNGIISTDTRGVEIVRKWQADGIENKVFTLTRQHIMPCQPVVLLAWLKNNEPQVLKNIQWVFEAKDYIRFRLTGEARAELTDYSGANLLNLNTRKYDDEILSLFGITEIKNALPPLCTSYEECGRITKETALLTGLREGIPVAGGMFDIDACALAANITDENHFCAIAGTWSINQYIRKEPVLDKSILMNSLYCLPDYYLIEESSPTSAGNFEWFIRTLLPEMKSNIELKGLDFYREINQLADSIKPNEFVPVFLPFLLASNVNPDAKGCFIGLSNYHTRAHLIRAVYEGVAFSHRYHIERLLQSRTSRPESVRLAGGAAKSIVWAQIIADVLQMPIDIVDANETGALGCAMAAAVAAKDYPSLEVAAKHMCNISHTLNPDPKNAVLYDKKYQLYLKTIEIIDPLWSNITKMIEEAF